MSLNKEIYPWIVLSAAGQHVSAFEWAVPRWGSVSGYTEPTHFAQKEAIQMWKPLLKESNSGEKWDPSGKVASDGTVLAQEWDVLWILNERTCGGVPLWRRCIMNANFACGKPFSSFASTALRSGWGKHVLGHTRWWMRCIAACLFMCSGVWKVEWGWKNEQITCLNQLACTPAVKLKWNTTDSTLFDFKRSGLSLISAVWGGDN